ncbi:hypothetical protein [Delftia tsuruhatensis]|uniref:hypothetical protein n=1 Tax=Delftia tsuruhatensis TaxID=180282 RepID=UPI0008EDAB9E|nr:hypothetical protein [Delftia tsuruhatensis]SFB29089.1 hypothetical protein SAMN05444579_103582 [Delftia tsuruhatensis]
MANAKKASMTTAEQTTETTATQAIAPVVAVETNPVASLEVDKAKEIEKRYQELVKKADSLGLTEDEEAEHAQLFLQRNKIKRQRGAEILKIKDMVTFHNVTPEEIFGEGIKTMYAQKIEVTKPAEEKATKASGFEIFKIYKSTSIRPSAYCKEYLAYNKDTKIKLLSIFELVDSIDEIFEYQIQTPEVKELMEKEGETIKATMKKQFDAFKKMVPAKKSAILYKTKEEKPKPTAAQ